ncbi:hypothetical protein [Natranaerobius thermophilus]|uniref:Uncharacterized protein n=1 Tax=Natranaerobius thermophilus (strain ATCC BAA-1301 / DSM 18059 / JW/NM-WN-LF) TaxID=457570 RepID=B2A7P7_NATTJ|nr:hypothetical protein [Natranaerobius thermophilus]ACB84349.1 conserved hypothetical protein [Natranaerobius thermophilus JW/NM-WN-LF]
MNTYAAAFRHLYWGFLFVSLDFRLQGFNVLPDIIGYILFALALGTLASWNENFNSAKPFTYVLIFLSIFTIYEAPAPVGPGVNFSVNPIGAMIGIISLILSLIAVYKVFMGIKALADMQEEFDLSIEAELRWKQFLFLNIATLFGIVLMAIPGLAVLAFIGIFIAGIILTIKIMSFMAKCESQIN